MFVGEEVGLNYSEGPQSGSPLVLLHGVLRCWQDFMPVLPSLSSRWHVFAIDHRGHGKSQQAPNEYLVRDYARDVEAFIRDAVDEPTVIYGHSLGAMVAASVAASLPDLVRGVVMEDPPFATMGDGITENSFFSLFSGIQELVGKGLNANGLARELPEMLIGSPGDSHWRRLGDVRDPVSLRFMAKCLADIDPTVLRPIVEARWLENFHYEEILSRLRCPSLLLQGDQDAGGMLSDKDAQRIVEIAPDCLLVKVLGCGHLIHWSRSETALQMIHAFLESL